MSVEVTTLSCCATHLPSICSSVSAIAGGINRSQLVPLRSLCVTGPGFVWSRILHTLELHPFSIYLSTDFHPQRQISLLVS